MFCFFFLQKKKKNFFAWHLYLAVLALCTSGNINETKESRALKNGESPSFPRWRCREKAESTLYRQQRPLKKDFFTLKTAFALATVVFFFCGVFVVQRYQIGYFFLAKTNVKINRHFFDSDICAMIYIAWKD